MSIAPPSPLPIYFWVMITASFACLLISKICLWKAAWHLKEARDIHKKGDVLLAQMAESLKEMQADTWPARTLVLPRHPAI